ncbi:MAG: oxidoreductase [Promethearchaeota archaeon]
MIEKNMLAAQFRPFKYKTVEDLKRELKNLSLELPIEMDCSSLKEEIQINKFLLPHRLAIQPMEGFDAKEDGTPGDLTMRRYDRYAKGGAALIWVESTAVIPEGKSNARQLYLSEENIRQFNQFVSAIKEKSKFTLKKLGFKAKSLIILQLNHSGRYSKKNGYPYPIKSYQNPALDKVMGVSEKEGIILTDEALEELEDIWVQKALLAREAGFDGVDIKSCHGYLISELISSHSRLNSKYGGKSLENRTRFFFNIIKKLKKSLPNGDPFLIATRFGVYDELPYPDGFGISYEKDKNMPSVDLTEPIQVIKKLYELKIKLINISAGNPRYKPYLTRPFDTPIPGTNLPPEHPLYSIYRIIKLTSLIKSQVPKDMVILGSGYSYLRHLAGYICAGLVKKGMVDICGFGRMSLANPDFPKQIFLNGQIDPKKTCITCSKCSELMRMGSKTGCVIRDEVYKKIYKEIKSKKTSH